MEKIRELYSQESREEATKLLDNIISNLKLADDAELIRWGNTLKRWRADHLLRSWWQLNSCLVTLNSLRRLDLKLENDSRRK